MLYIKQKKIYHSEPLGLPQSQELCQNDAHHPKHKGQLVYELHLQLRIQHNPFFYHGICR